MKILSSAEWRSQKFSLGRAWNFWSTFNDIINMKSVYYKLPQIVYFNRFTSGASTTII